MRLTAVLAFALLAACGKPTAAPANGGDAGATTRAHADAVAVGPAVAWPSSAPAYLPRYPGATVVTAISGTAAGGSSTMLTFTTSDPGKAVGDFYMAHAASAGLKQAATADSSGAHMVMASNPATGESVTVQTQQQDGRTQATLIAGRTDDRHPS